MVEKSSFYEGHSHYGHKRLSRLRPKHPLTPDQVAEIEAEIRENDALAETARAYEAEKQRVMAAWLQGSVGGPGGCSPTFADIVGAVMVRPAHTMDGVLIKAAALEAWGQNPFHVFHGPGLTWPQDFVADVLRSASANA